MIKTKLKIEPLPATPPRAMLPAASVAPIKRYDENFRKNAVEHWIKTGKPGTQIATELGISYPSLKEWKRRYHGGRPARTRQLGTGKPHPAVRAGPRARATRHSKKNAGHLHRTVAARFTKSSSRSTTRAVTTGAGASKYSVQISSTLSAAGNPATAKACKSNDSFTSTS